MGTPYTRASMARTIRLRRVWTPLRPRATDHTDSATPSRDNSPGGSCQDSLFRFCLTIRHARTRAIGSWSLTIRRSTASRKRISIVASGQIRCVAPLRSDDPWVRFGSQARLRPQVPPPRRSPETPNGVKVPRVRGLTRRPSEWFALRRPRAVVNPRRCCMVAAPWSLESWS